MRKVVKQTGGQNLISCEGGQDTLACKFQAIRPMRSQENVRNLQIWTASLCKKNPTNISEINKPWRKSK